MEDKTPRSGEKSEKPPCWPEKVSDKGLKQQVIGPCCHPLFWGSNSQQSTHQQAQVKAGRSDLVPLSEIFCSLERGPAHSAFIKRARSCVPSACRACAKAPSQTGSSRHKRHDEGLFAAR